MITIGMSYIMAGKKIMDAVKIAALKTSSNTVLVSWSTGKTAMPRYRLYRRLVSAGKYLEIGSGIGTTFLDDISKIKENGQIEYMLKTEYGDVVAAIYRMADPWLLAMAGDYIWQLKHLYASEVAVAYCLPKNWDMGESGEDAVVGPLESVAHCPECFSVELNKITKSRCGTCDGSGRLKAYFGPVPFNFAPRRYSSTKDSIGNIEVEKELIYAWTGNTPNLNKGDVVIASDHKKYVVQDIPDKLKMHSTTGNSVFVVRQDITLRRVDDGEYPSLTYGENKKVV